jgi:hypothetical protein
MAIYLSRQGGAEALLNRQIAHVRGRINFMSVRGRCDAANVSNTTTRRTGAQTPRLAASVRAIIVSNYTHLMLLNALRVKAITLSMTVTARSGTKRGK